jgi:hypothetical protein
VDIDASAPGIVLSGTISSSSGSTSKIYLSGAQSGLTLTNVASVYGNNPYILVAASDTESSIKAKADYVCDGTADEVQINAAIAAIPTEGGTVILAAGNYNTADKITMASNVVLKGAGVRTIIDAASFADDVLKADTLTNITISDLYIEADDRTSDAATPASLNIVDCTTVNISGMHFTGNGDGTHPNPITDSGDGIRVDGGSNIKISDIYVQGHHHNIYAGRGCTNLIIDQIISETPGVEHICLEWDSNGEHTLYDNQRATISNIVGITAGQSGVYVQDWQDVTINNVTLYDTWSAGLMIDHCINVTANNIIDIGNRGGGGSVGGAFVVGIYTGTASETYNVTLSNINAVLANTVANTSGISINAENVKVTNFTINDANYIGVDIYPDADRITLTNGTFDGCDNYTFDCDGDNVIIEGCHVLNNGASIFNLDTGTGYIIRGNVATVAAAQSPHWLFDVESDVSDLLITDNIFIDAGNSHIDADNVVVTGNKWQGYYGPADYVMDFTGTGVRVDNNIVPAASFTNAGFDATGATSAIVHDQSAEVATGTITIQPYGTTHINSSGGAVTATLGDGQYPGQIKYIVMTDATTSSTVSVTNHATSDPEVFTFDALNEYLTVQWDGTEWITLAATSTT